MPAGRSSDPAVRFAKLADLHGRAVDASRAGTPAVAERLLHRALAGFPTDRRRSDNHLESHQPWTLRTRCMHDSTVRLRVRQAGPERTLRNLRTFLFARADLQNPAHDLGPGEQRKRAGTGRPEEFAEPGTLSSTFPTNLPLPRSAPRGASSYRRPVLGAGGTLCESGRGASPASATARASQAAGEHPPKRGWQGSSAMAAAPQS